MRTIKVLQNLLILICVFSIFDVANGVKKVNSEGESESEFESDDVDDIDYDAIYDEEYMPGRHEGHVGCSSIDDSGEEDLDLGDTDIEDSHEEDSGEEDTKAKDSDEDYQTAQEEVSKAEGKKPAKAAPAEKKTPSKAPKQKKKPKDAYIPEEDEDSDDEYFGGAEDKKTPKKPKEPGSKAKSGSAQPSSSQTKAPPKPSTSRKKITLPEFEPPKDGDLTVTKETCADGKGHLLRMTEGGKPLYDVCFNYNTESPFFTTNIIDLAGKNVEQVKGWITFKAKSPLSATELNKLYETDSQVKQFETKFGTSQLYATKKVDAKGAKLETEKFHTDNFFTKCQLTPRNDFAPAKEQRDTLLYQNCVPAKSMKSLNWNAVVEAYAREMATTFKTPIRVYTGVYKQLLGTDKEGKKHKLFLDMEKGKVEVPYALYKLIVNEKTKEAVAFFTSNDNNMDKKEISRFNNICKKNVCEDIGVDLDVEMRGDNKGDEEAQKRAKMNRAGFTICCNYAEFKEIIKYLNVDLPVDAKLLKSDAKVDAFKKKQTAAQQKKQAAQSKGSKTPAPAVTPSTQAKQTKQTAPLAEKSSSKAKKPLKKTLTNLADKPVEKIEYPEIKREGADLEKYVKEQLASLPARAKDDTGIVYTGKVCAKGLGTLYEIWMKGAKKPMIEVCHHDESASAVFSTHEIDLHGKKYEKSSHLNFRAKFFLDGLGIQRLYDMESQVKQFEEQFGKDQQYVSRKVIKTEEDKARKIIKDTEKYHLDNYFSRCHLTPHADFATEAERWFTYYFQNCYPGKQTMNAQNWSRVVEHYARKMARHLGRALRVFTGVFKQLVYKNTNGTKTKCFLDMNGKKVKIPAMTYKLITDEKTNKTTAFFTSNDTNMDKKAIVKFKRMCNDVCEDIGVDVEVEADLDSDDGEIQKVAKMNRAGHTICCSYKDFRRYIQYLPINIPEDAPLLTSDKHTRDHAEFHAKQRLKREASLKRRLSNPALGSQITSMTSSKKRIKHKQ